MLVSLVGLESEHDQVGAAELAADPEFEVFRHHDDILQPVEQQIPASGKWTFPAASVSAVELDLEEAKGRTES